MVVAPARLHLSPSSSTLAAPRWHSWLSTVARHKPALVVALAGLLVGLRRSESPYADSDILWGARAGIDFLKTGRIPRTDSYSWTAHGTAWIPNGWGWNALLGITYKAAGTVGIAVLGIVMVSAIATLVGRAARRAEASTAWTALAFVIVAGVFALFLYPRAQLTDYLSIFVFPLLLPTVLFAYRARAAGAAALTVFVQILWMNLHTAAVLGPMLIAALGIGHVVGARADGQRRAASTRLIGLVAFAAAGCTATPYGLAPIAHLEAVRRASVGLISEWRPVGIGSADQLLGLAALALSVGAAWLAFRARRLDTALVLLLLAAATSSAIRFAPMGALYAVPELAAAAGHVRVRRGFLNRICALAFVVLAVSCLAGMRGFADPGIANTSPALVAKLPHGCRLLNDFGVGGAVILRRPDVPVSIDSRNDLYGRAAELQSLAVLTDPVAGLRYVDMHNLSCVLVQSQAPLVPALERSGRWRLAGSDGVRSLLIRTAA